MSEPDDRRIVSTVFVSGKLGGHRLRLRDVSWLAGTPLLAFAIWLNNHWLRGKLDRPLRRALTWRRGLANPDQR